MTDCPTSFTDSCLSDIKASRLIDLEYTSILIDLYCYRSGYNGNVDWRRPVRHDFFFETYYVFPIHGFGENVDLYPLLTDPE